MLKNYKVGAYIYQFEEGKAPAGAIEWPPKKAEEPPKAKAKKKPANKKKAVENK